MQALTSKNVRITYTGTEFFGYDNTKYAFVFVIMATPILTGALDGMPELRANVLALMNTLSPSVFFVGMLLLSLALLAASACLSVRFYERADLA